MIIRTKIIVSIFIIKLLVVSSLAQTTSWKLVWDANSAEENIVEYQVFRDTSPQPTNMVATVSHPSTVYEDKTLQKGERYFYRLKAVNSSGNESDYSDEISAAIPKISLTQTVWQMALESTLQITLNEFVQYESGESGPSLIWAVSGNDYLQVEITSGNILVITTSAAWIGTEELTLTVTDPDGFYDQAIIRIAAVENESTLNTVSSAITFNYDVEQAAIQIMYNTTLPSRDFVEYGMDQSYSHKTNQDHALVTFHQHSLTGILPDQNYYFRIISMDSQGQLSFLSDSLFSTGLKTAADKITAYPIPYREQNPNNVDGIFFSNLEPGSKIKIYDLLGELVFSGETNVETYKWNVRNKAGKKVQSGLYLYVVHDPANHKSASGKLIIIR